MEKIDKQISRLIDLYSATGDNLEGVTSRINTLRQKKATLAEEQAQPTKTPEVAINAIEVARQTFETGTIAEQRAILDALIDKIIFYPDRMEIRWKYF